jgi:AraC family transcriptional regulator, ethanolamine operon transcriptional activator
VNDDKFVETLSRMPRRPMLRPAPVRDWRLRTVDLDGITLRVGSEGAAGLCSGLVSNDCFHFWMVLGDGYGVAVDGLEFDCRTIAWIAPGKSFITRSEKPPRWLNISVAADLVLKWAALHQDTFDARLLDRNCRHRPTRSPVALIALVRRLFRMENRDPGQLHSAEAEPAARAQLLDSILGMFPRVASDRDLLRRSMNHMKLLNNALDWLETHRGDVVHTEHLCVATGVSERTLRNLFHKYLGMSPHRYLMMRRLHSIRSRIRRAVPGDTITRICAQHGVWDFGRFSRQYLMRFGELPSRSLHSARKSLRSEEVVYMGNAR